MSHRMEGAEASFSGSGITELAGGRQVGKLGGLTLAYYGVATLLSVTVGLILVNLLQPGIDVGTGESHLEGC